MKKVKELLKIIKEAFGLNDLCVLAGSGMFTWGVWQIYMPAAVILLGAGLIWWGLTGSRKEKSK